MVWKEQKIQQLFNDDKNIYDEQVEIDRKQREIKITWNRSSDVYVEVPALRM